MIDTKSILAIIIKISETGSIENSLNRKVVLCKAGAAAENWTGEKIGLGIGAREALETLVCAYGAQERRRTARLNLYSSFIKTALVRAATIVALTSTFPNTLTGGTFKRAEEEQTV